MKNNNLIKIVILSVFTLFNLKAFSQTKKVQDSYSEYGAAWAQNGSDLIYTNSDGNVEIKKFNGLFWTTLFSAKGFSNHVNLFGASTHSSQYYNGDLYFVWFGYYLNLPSRTIGDKNMGFSSYNFEALLKWDGTTVTVVDTFEFPGVTYKLQTNGILDMDTLNNKLIISGYSKLFNTGSTVVEYDGTTIKKSGTNAFNQPSWQLVNLKDSMMVVADGGLYMYNGSNIVNASLLNNINVDFLSSFLLHVYKHPDSTSYIIRKNNFTSYYCKSGKLPQLVIDDSASYGKDQNYNRFRQEHTPTFFATKNGAIYTFAFTNDDASISGADLPLTIQKYNGNKITKIKLPGGKFNQIVAGGPIYIPKVFGKEKIYFTCNQGVFELEGDAFFSSGSDTLFSASISGKVFLDKNGDNIFNGTDEAQIHKCVYTANGYAGFTNNLGNYSLQNIAIGKDTLKYNPSLLHILHQPINANRNLKLGKDSNIIRNIVLRYDSARKDISIKIRSNRGVRHRRGFTETYSLFITNNSTEIKSGTIDIKLDPGYNVKSTTDPNFTSTTDGYQYTFTNIGAYQTISANFDLTTALTLNLNDKVTITAKTDNATLTWDNNTSNNYDTTKYRIVSSYDPNDKSSDKDGNNMPGLSTINYHINFQNMGNDTAYTVVVADTIENNLQLETISNVTASHPFSMSLVDNNILLFTFNNILLVDSATNEKGSKGFIDFKINANLNLPHNSEIKNKASIYFDFNEPVITNYSVILIKDPTNSIYKINAKSSINIFPNPATHQLSITAKNTIQQVVMYDMQGKEIAIFDEDFQTMDVSKFNNALYLLAVKTNMGIEVCKILIQK